MSNSTKHEVIRRLGEGPICEVFVGRVIGGLNRDVTIKRLTEESAQQERIRDTFYRSVDRWSSLLHDGLVSLHSIDRNEHCVAYDVHDLSAQQAIDTGGRPAEDVAAWIRDAFAGLQHCHEKGYLHFNLKPTNVLVDARGRARLIDGACFEWQADKRLPAPTARPKHLAPEMLEPSLGRVGPGTDIYCLALTFLEVLFGGGFDASFVGSSSGAAEADRAWLRWHLDPDRRLPDPDQHPERLPSNLWPVFERALRQSPALRYLDCGELLHDLARAVESPASHATPTPAAESVPTASPGPGETPAEAPRLEDLPTKPKTPIILRPFGCEGEMIGMNTDCFTLGTIEGVDAPLPAALASRDNPTKLRFVRAAEGWRVALVEGLSLYVNQTLCDSSTPLQAGDVLRMVPGGPGLQFTLTHDKAEPLVRIAARHAPRLLRGTHEAPPSRLTDPVASAADRVAAPKPSAPETPQEAPSTETLSGEKTSWWYWIGGLIALAILLALLPLLASPKPDPQESNEPAAAESTGKVSSNAPEPAAP